MERGSGLIPRYLNWKLETAFTRERVPDMFARVHSGNVIKAAIKMKPAEKNIRDIGFRAWKYVDVINQERELSGFDNEILCLLLVRPSLLETWL